MSSLWVGVRHRAQGIRAVFLRSMRLGERIPGTTEFYLLARETRKKGMKVRSVGRSGRNYGYPRSIRLPTDQIHRICVFQIDNPLGKRIREFLAIFPANPTLFVDVLRDGRVYFDTG
jgi:hypothetical protein